jgi:hypothetical protein
MFWKMFSQYLTGAHSDVVLVSGWRKTAKQTNQPGFLEFLSFASDL